MAFTYRYQKGSALKTLYNVDFAVGLNGGYNMRDDVMLVQALLNMCFYELEALQPPFGQNPLEVDGWIGPATQRHIEHFQHQVVKDGGGNVAQDGVFDPFRAPGVSSSVSHTRYGLEVLNYGCSNEAQDRGLRNFVDLPHRPDMPVLLRNALKTEKKEATRHRGVGGKVQIGPVMQEVFPGIFAPPTF